MDKKMAKLERRTQEAIHTLIRLSFFFASETFDSQVRSGQRLSAQKGQSDDLVGAMKAQERQNASASLSDEDDD